MISIYCNINDCNTTIQYSLRKYQYIVHCNILWYIAICCNVYCLNEHCCLNAVIIQSLHHNNDWTSSNLEYTLQFLTICMDIDPYFFTPNTYICTYWPSHNTVCSCEQHTLVSPSPAWILSFHHHDLLIILCKNNKNLNRTNDWSLLHT